MTQEGLSLPWAEDGFLRGRPAPALASFLARTLPRALLPQDSRTRVPPPPANSRKSQPEPPSPSRPKPPPPPPCLWFTRRWPGFPDAADTAGTPGSDPADPAPTQRAPSHPPPRPSTPVPASWHHLLTHPTHWPLGTGRGLPRNDAGGGAPRSPGAGSGRLGGRAPWTQGGRPHAGPAAEDPPLS